MMRTLLALVFATLSFGVFAQTRYYDSLFAAVDKTVDIQYGTGLNASNQPVTLALDVYQPQGDGSNNRVPIIVAHGGSFLPDQGSKADPYIQDFADDMAKKGYVVFAINYRLGWQPGPQQEQNTRNILPAAWRGIQDYKTAVRFLRKTIAEDGNPYRIDGSKIIGCGFGAGAYLPVNMMAFDVPSEISISPELIQKNVFGQPNGTPYIDTTIQNLGGLAYVNGPWSQYSYKIDMIGNFSGAVPTLKIFDTGTFPNLVSVHSTEDEATPYRTDVVFALGLFPVIEVSGSHDIHEKLENMGQNQLWKSENRDGYSQVRIAGDTPSDNKYREGLLTFPGEIYMWSGDGDSYDQNYNPTYKAWMDSVSTYSSARFQKWIAGSSSISEETVSANLVKLFPNPASDLVNVTLSTQAKIDGIRLTSVNGSTIKEVSGNQFSVSGLESGVYFLQIQSQGETIVKRLIKD